MQDWNPALYLRFANERTRPAAELLARVPSSLHSPARSLHIVDLGCGPGNSTELLVERFPGADVLGVDNSEAMLETARKQLPQARFEAGDIASWAPAEGEPAPDLIYANASIQWVGGHESLIPRLFSLQAHAWQPGCMRWTMHISRPTWTSSPVEPQAGSATS